MNNVALYIYNRTISAVTPLTADTTLYTADNDILTADATQVGGLEDITANRVELYNDETIQITSSIQDIKDISKVRTDFSKSFTVPASKINNGIFQHWYESAVDNGFDQRVKYRGFIEIDTIPFRYGGFALNSASVKDNKVESYNITFYGDTKNITDLIREDKLNSLDFSDLNHDFEASEIIDRIDGTINDGVYYPLFAHDRLYDFGNSSSDDVTTNTGAILWKSLFPAIGVPDIMNRIQNKYGITLTGAFLNYTQFTGLAMLFKNAESLVVPTLNQRVNFTSKDVGLDDTGLNLTTDEIGLQFAQQKISITVNPEDSTVYSVLIYKNGQPHLQYANRTGNSDNLIFFGTRNTQNQNDKYTVYISSDAPFTYNTILRYSRLVGGVTLFNAFSSDQTTEAIIDIVRYAPDIKIMDFLAGLIKAFSITILPISDTEFEFIPLELYYNNGKLNDITKNVITDSIDVKKTSSYKNITFTYETSENILNEEFRQLFSSQRGYDYGDLKYEQIDSLESSTFDIKLPFENPIYERKSDSEFLTATFKNKDLENYVPKPVLMYKNNNQSLTTPIKIDKETSFENISSYIRFSNEIDNGGLMTLNWGEEVSPWYLDAASQGLYIRHYSNYIGNVFSLKGRLLALKAIFNPVNLNNIKLNDRIVIRDKRYTINNFTPNLTTGEVDFELLTDYRDIGSISIGNRYSSEDTYLVNNYIEEIEVFLLMAGSTIVEKMPSDVSWITYSLGFMTEDEILIVTLEPNNTGFTRTGHIVLEHDGVEVLIPIVQRANVQWNNTTITFDNTNIKFDNDGTSTT